MTEIDFDRLGDVWREQPDPAEMARLQRTAADVARRARFAHVVDIGAAIAVAAVVIILVASNPTTQTLIMGSAAILVLLGSNIRQRRLRQVELRSLTGGTEEMLNQSIERVEATVKRTRISLFGLGPALLIGWVFMNVVSDWTPGRFLSEEIGQLWVRLLWSGGVLILLGAGAYYFALSIRRGRQELERLVAMRDAYRQERESTAP